MTTNAKTTIEIAKECGFERILENEPIEMFVHLNDLTAFRKACEADYKSRCEAIAYVDKNSSGQISMKSYHGDYFDMTTKNKALEQAIATLRKAYVVRLGSHPWTDMLDETIKACKDALAETNEPVGYMTTASLGNLRSGHDVIVGKKLREPDRKVSVFIAPPNLEAKIAELEGEMTDLVDSRDEQIAELTAKCEKMRDLLADARDDVANQLSEYQDLLPYKQHRFDAQKETLDAIDQALEECK